MLRDIQTFTVAICKNVVSLMSGIISVVLWALAAALEPMPVSMRWSFLVAGVIALLVACFQVWREAHQGEREAKAALNPKLEILRVPQPRNPANRTRRITVRNLCGTVIRFGARLDEITPPISHDVPVRLQLTNTPAPYLEADIPAMSEHSVDVFVEAPDGIYPGLLIATEECVASNRPFRFARRRYEIKVSVFPVHPSSGATVSHRFHIIPQPDGSFIFGDAGTA
jgi:hypothetical protein